MLELVEHQQCFVLVDQSARITSVKKPDKSIRYNMRTSCTDTAHRDQRKLVSALLSSDQRQGVERVAARHLGISF